MLGPYLLPDLHTEISRSWKRPFYSCLTSTTIHNNSQRGNTCMIKVTRRCLRYLVIWKEPCFPRPSVGGAMSLEDSDNRCIRHGLGSGHGWPLHKGSVERASNEWGTYRPFPSLPHVWSLHLGGLKPFSTLD